MADIFCYIEPAYENSTLGKRRMKMKRLILLCTMVLLPLLVAAQPPDTLWTHTYGGNGEEYAYDVQQTTDGGYIFAGSTTSYGAGHQFYVVKTDANGGHIWGYDFGGSTNDYARSVQQSTDGGYVIAGYTYTTSVTDACLIKIDNAGNQIWQQQYGQWSNSDLAYCVRQTADGGYVIAGDTYSYGPDCQIYVIKTDSLGNQVWERNIGGAGHDQGRSIQQTTDGGYIIAGQKNTFSGGYWDVCLVKTNADGNPTWERTFGGNGYDYGNSVQQTSDGGYIIVGTTLSFGAGYDDVYLIKTDASGNLDWQRTFGGNSFDKGHCVQTTIDGGYAIAGGTSSFGGGYQVYLIKTDTNGNETWQCTLGGNNTDFGYSLLQTNDGGYVIAGQTQPAYGGTCDAYLIKTEPDVVPPNITFSLIPFASPIQIPSTGGSFEYYAFLTNEDSAAANVSLWVKQILPDGSTVDPFLGPFAVSLPPGTRGWYRIQNVPGSTMPGEYQFIGCAGYHPNFIWVADTLTYTKLTTGDGGWVSDWANTGDPFPGETGNSRSPAASNVTAPKLPVISPNPFNATTAIRFDLPEAFPVNLTVYDTAGRMIATLVDCWREAGGQEVTWDGSDYSSGLYFVKLQTGDHVSVQKMVLLK
ncbi:MAG: T9SS C-terminal target domain-containing protein [Candidatus Zixiibacteriota bacterium]|nr:MAG: T9SS C-terminal target domain-containing protein [candidate division Zixibacteria bacterium]